ncbi:MAG: peptidoglycan-associated lipoprotein Pal [Deltaproteobacteria bacterium]|nr:peptidoglycan-associated lipoprotein Pal [Deltaproteobacteria bacterium]
MPPEWNRGFFAIGVVAGFFFLLSACSTPTAEKPQDSATTQKAGVSSQKPVKAASSKTSPQAAQASSLDAQRKGTLGKKAETGPLKDVNFDFDRHDLRQDAREILKTNATWLKGNPSARVDIEGHADERGTTEYNLALGAKRADSVKRYLVDLGVSSGRLATTSYGEELPLCKEQNEICWSKNRRAHFAIKTAPGN